MRQAYRTALILPSCIHKALEHYNMSKLLCHTRSTPLWHQGYTQDTTQPKPTKHSTTLRAKSHALATTRAPMTPPVNFHVFSALRITWWHFSTIWLYRSFETHQIYSQDFTAFQPTTGPTNVTWLYRPMSFLRKDPSEKISRLYRFPTHDGTQQC